MENPTILKGKNIDDTYYMWTEYETLSSSGTISTGKYKENYYYKYNLTIRANPGYTFADDFEILLPENIKYESISTTKNDNNATVTITENTFDTFVTLMGPHGYVDVTSLTKEDLEGGWPKVTKALEHTLDELKNTFGATIGTKVNPQTLKKETIVTFLKGNTPI